AYALAFLSAGLIAYLGSTVFYPPLRARVESDYLEVDRTLKSIFYTAYDARIFVALKYGGTIVAFSVGMFLFNSFVFGAFMAGIVYPVPGMLLNRIVNGRRDKLDHQTSDVMTALSATVKSGMTLEESITEIAANMRPPVSQEFALIKQRLDSGQAIASPLKAAAGRSQAARLSLMLQSMIASQERGGRLSAWMGRLSGAMREIGRVEERIKPEPSGLRLSARLMVFLPFVIGGFLYIA